MRQPYEPIPVLPPFGDVKDTSVKLVYSVKSKVQPRGIGCRRAEMKNEYRWM